MPIGILEYLGTYLLEIVPLILQPIYQHVCKQLKDEKFRARLSSFEFQREKLSFKHSDFDITNNANETHNKRFIFFLGLYFT